MKNILFRCISMMVCAAMLIGCFSTVGLAAKKVAVDQVYDFEAETLEINSGIYTIEGNALYNRDTSTSKPGDGELGDMTLNFTVKKDALYHIWALAKPNSATKSVYVSLNKGAYSVVNFSMNMSEFTYVKLGSVQCAAGDAVEVNISACNGWFYIDKFTVAIDGYNLKNPDGTAAGTEKPITETVKYSDTIPSFAVQDNSLLVEAKDTAYVSLWQNKTTDTGRSALYINMGTYDAPAVGARGFMEFDFTVAEDGDYVIWAYNNPTSSNKNAWVTNPDGSYATAAMSTTANSYSWTKLAVYKDVKAKKKMSFKLIPQTSYFTIASFCIIKGTDAIVFGEDGSVSETPVFDETVIYPTPKVLPESGVHPRVYFKKEDIPQIKKNMELEENATALDLHRRNLAKDIDGVLPAASGATNYTAAPLGVIESYAFEYAMNGTKEYGQKAVDAMCNYVDTAVFDTTNGNAYNNWGQMEYTIGLVYDWCNDLLTDDIKVKFRDAVVKYTAAKVGYPPSNPAVTGHGTEGPVLRDLLVPAIAMYDDYPSLYLNAAGKICAEYAPVKEFLYGAGAGSLQGDHYTYYRDTWAVNTLWLMDKLGLANVFGENQQYETYWYLYARRGDGSTLRDGDTHQNNTVGGSYLSYARLEMYLANYYKDPYLKWEFLRQKNLEGTLSDISSNFSTDCVERLIVNDGTVQAKDPSTLPLSRYFASPKGAYIARTGWKDGVDSPAVVAEMKVGEYWTSNHQHLDAGAFQIYYKGALATDAGYYQASFSGEGTSDYNSSHWKNYATRTVAHNAILIQDANETQPSGYVNDGGQRLINDRNECKSLDSLKKEFKTGSVLAHEHGPDEYTPNYTYLKGDITDAYSDKASEVLRSFMFLNLKDDEQPAAMVVFDKVTASKAELKKSFVLNSVSAPEINGTRTVVKDTRAFNDISRYNGRLTCDTLLPAAGNVEITAYNGMDKYAYTGSVASYATAPDNTEGGGSRTEISPKASSETDYMLHVLQIGDADAADAPETVLIETATHAGAVVADKAVLFSKSRERTADEVAFTFSGEGEFEVIVADLQAGTWSVSRDGAYVCDAAATTDGGVISFNGAAGAYTLTYKNADETRYYISRVPEQTDRIGIRVNKQFIYTDVDPIIENDRTLVPMRAIFEAIGAEVSYDDATATATGVKANRTVTITDNSTTAYVNGEAVTLDVPAKIVDDRFLVPIRFISENLGCRVTWDNDAKIVGIHYTKTSAQHLRENQLLFVDVVQSGDDGNGNSIENAVDGYVETRWAPAGDDYKSAWGVFDLGQSYSLDKLYLAYLYGSSRVYKFAIEVSEDGETYTRVLTTQSSGKTDDFEEFDLGGVKARYIKYLGGGNSSNSYNSVGELQVTEKK